MSSYVALLRGIGPGNPNMRNEKLRGVFERLGHENVRSVISSGNILFESPDSDIKSLEGTIEQGLHEDLGINSAAIIRSRADLQALVDSDPFTGLTHGRETYLTVTFLKDRQQLLGDRPQVSVDQASQILEIDAQGAAVCAVTDTTVAKTPDLMAKLEKALGKGITTRTWKTVERILAKL